MRIIIYAGGELLTGDAIAAAVLEYGEALAESSAADTVEIPIVEADGSRSRATILIGPASQIVTIESHDGRPELLDPETVRWLKNRTRRLRPEARPEAEAPDTTWTDDF